MLTHRDLNHVKARRTDSDSGIHSFGSTSSRMGKQNFIILPGHENVSSGKKEHHSWRDNILDGFEVNFMGRIDHEKVNRSKSCDERVKHRKCHQMSSGISSSLHHNRLKTVRDHDYGNLGCW